MIPVIEIFNDVKAKANTSANGALGISLFNKFSNMAEDEVLDFLTGDISALKPPEPYLTQKNRDWLAAVTTSKPLVVKKGFVLLPEDYYRYENQYLLTTTYSEEQIENDCAEIVEIAKKEKRTIDLLGLNEFSSRMDTYIESLKPSFDRPISKMINNGIEYEPSDIGNVVLEYVRRPKKAAIASMTDTKYNTEVPDATKSTDYEWHPGLRKLLVWVISDMFHNRNSNRSGKEMNMISKDVRG